MSRVSEADCHLVILKILFY